MRKIWTRAVSLLLCGCLLITAFSGCSSKKPVDGIEGKATQLAYNAEGRFTTTLTVDGAGFSEDLTAGDIEVKYTKMDEERLDELAQKATAEGKDEIDASDCMTEVQVAVNSVVRKDEKTLEITFTDEKASENLPQSYFVLVNKNKTGAKKPAGGVAEVVFPDHTVTPNITSVSVFDKDIRLTLELKDGEFAENVQKEKITLGGCLEKMNIDSISAAGKNLTMQLTGDIVKHESSNAYVDGLVTLDRSAFKNGHQSSTVKISVSVTSFGFTTDNLTAENGKVTVPLQINGYRISDKAAAADFKIDGAKVIGVERQNESTALLTLSVAGATDKNRAASALDGKTVTVAGKAIGSDNDISFEADFSSVGFYPVFDYAEEKDGKYNITLILYAHFGTFADSLDKSAVSFADDFKGAEVISLTRQDDTVAELTLSLPSGGKTVEQMSLNGTVSLKAAALVNRWGDSASSDSAYTRSYSQTSMGRDLSDGDISIIKNIVGGFGNTTMGTIFGVGSGLASAGSAAISVLEMLGVIESEKAKLDKIYAAINDLSSSLNSMSIQISDQTGKILQGNISDFYSSLSLLSESRETALDLISNAKRELKDEGIKAPDEPKNGEVSPEWDIYMKKLMERVKSLDSQGCFTKFAHYYGQVQSKVNPPLADISIIDQFDEYMTYYHNFDVLAYGDRERFRTLISYELLKGSILICTYNKYAGKYPNENTIRNVSNNYEAARKLIAKKSVNRRTDKKAYMYLANKTVTMAYWTYVMDKNTVTLSDAEAKAFIKRLHGKTIVETVEQLGIDLTFRYNTFAEDKKKYAGNGFLYEGKYESPGDGFFTKEYYIDKNKALPENKAIKDNDINKIPNWVESHKAEGGAWWSYKVLVNKPGLVLSTYSG